MSPDIEALRGQIKKAQERILYRTRAIRTLVEDAEPGRRARAKTLLRGKAVRLASETDEIRAFVGAHQYEVTIDLGRMGEDTVVRRVNCTCFDHGRTAACKHVLAVVGAFVLTQKKAWDQLKSADKALMENP